jgi:SAM-dependent methyltransferase
MAVWMKSRQKHDEFLNPISFQRLDFRLSRTAILNALTEQLPKLHGTLLDVGCGEMPYKRILLAPPSRVTKYIGLDLREGHYARFGPFDLEWDGKSIPLPDGSIDCAIATEVFEQCPHPETVMTELARVLKPRSLFFFTVPFLWPIHAPPHDQYRFTPYAIERQLKSSGFVDISLQVFGGWDASLAQMLALWVRRRPMRTRYRVVATAVALPIVRLLTKMDSPPTAPWQAMITGMSGTAVRG